MVVLTSSYLCNIFVYLYFIVISNLRVFIKLPQIIFIRQTFILQYQIPYITRLDPLNCNLTILIPLHLLLLPQHLVKLYIFLADIAHPVLLIRLHIIPNDLINSIIIKNIHVSLQIPYG